MPRFLMNAQKIQYDAAAGARRFYELYHEVGQLGAQQFGGGNFVLCYRDAQHRAEAARPKLYNQKFRPGHTQRMIDAANGLAGHQNVYLGNALVNSNLPTAERGHEADVVCVLSLAGDGDADQGNAAKAISGIEPTFIVQTSATGGTANLQPHYLFSRPLAPAGAKELALLFWRKCGGDINGKVITSIWRVPGTLNHPDANKIEVRGRLPEPQRVQIVGGTGKAIDPKIIRAALEAMPDLHSEKGVIAVSASVEWKGGGESDRTAILAKVPPHVWALMQQPSGADKDRSKHCARVIFELYKIGLTCDEVYILAQGMPFAKKFEERGDLDREVASIFARWKVEGEYTHEKGKSLLSKQTKSKRAGSNIVTFSAAKESRDQQATENTSQPAAESPQTPKQHTPRIIKIDTIEESTEGGGPPGEAADAVKASLPGGFRYHENGSIEYRKGIDRESGDYVWSWLCSPLEIMAATRDQDGKSWGLSIRVKNADDKWHILNVPMSAIATESEQVLGILASHGLRSPAIAGVKNQLKLLFSLVKPRRRASCVGQVGWHPQSDGMAFALPDEIFGNAGKEQIVFQALDNSRHSYRTAGTLEGWQKNVARLAQGNSRLVFALSSAFAGPLLKLQGVDGGGFHYLGRSSCGKTTALHMAASAWGGGGQNGNVDRWRATDNALEGLAMARCDTLLCLDEMAEIDSRAAGKAVYMLSNGQGKDRLSPEATLRQKHEWRVLFLSTGEISIADKVAEDGRKPTAGQAVRIIDIDVDAGKGIGIFENLHGFEKASEFADAIKAASAKHYGHASREFLRKLAADIDGAAKKVSKHMKAFETEMCPASADGQVRRACRRFALVAAAGCFATEWGILPWPIDEAGKAAKKLFKEWLHARGASGPLELQNALAQVRLILERDGSSRFTSYEKPDRLTINRLGFVRSEGDRQIFFVLPEAFKNELCKGFNAISVARALNDAQALITTGKKFQKKVHLPDIGQSWCYAIDGGALFNPDIGGKEFLEETPE